MTKRIVVAGVVAGLVLFFWSFISHMVLPLGEVGISSLPADETVSAALRNNIVKKNVATVNQPQKVSRFCNLFR